MPRAGRLQGCHIKWGRWGGEGAFRASRYLGQYGIVSIHGFKLRFFRPLRSLLCGNSNRFLLGSTLLVLVISANGNV